MDAAKGINQKQLTTILTNQRANKLSEPPKTSSGNMQNMRQNQFKLGLANNPMPVQNNTTNVPINFNDLTLLPNTTRTSSLSSPAVQTRNPLKSLMCQHFTRSNHRAMPASRPALTPLTPSAKFMTAPLDNPGLGPQLTPITASSNVMAAPVKLAGFGLGMRRMVPNPSPSLKSMSMGMHRQHISRNDRASQLLRHLKAQQKCDQMLAAKKAAAEKAAREKAEKEKAEKEKAEMEAQAANSNGNEPKKLLSDNNGNENQPKKTEKAEAPITDIEKYALEILKKQQQMAMAKAMQATQMRVQQQGGMYSIIGGKAVFIPAIDSLRPALVKSSKIQRSYSVFEGGYMRSKLVNTQLKRSKTGAPTFSKRRPPNAGFKILSGLCGNEVRISRKSLRSQRSQTCTLNSIVEDRRTAVPFVFF